MKKFYEIPELDILRFDVKDTLTSETGEDDWVPGTSDGFEEW